MPDKKDKTYWQENIWILKLLLGLWCVVSFLLAIVFVDQLDQVRIGGIKLGFWVAQQGSLYFYVVLIFVYIRFMNRLDHKYKVDPASLKTRHEEN